MILIIVLATLIVLSPKPPAFKKAQPMPGKCSASCGALDPIF